MRVLGLLCVALVASAACAPVERRCRADDECEGGAVCAFDTCALVTCNEDAECSGRSCVDGLCAPGLLREGDTVVIGGPGPDGEDDTPPGQPGEPGEDGAWNPYEPGCEPLQIEPARDAVDVSPLAEVRVRFPDEDTRAAATVVAMGDVPFARLDDGATATLIPLVALTGGASYTVEVTTSCGLERVSFTVKDEARPTASVSAGFRLQDATVTPAATGNLFAMMGLAPMLVSLGEPGGLLAFKDSDGAQQQCEATVPLASISSQVRPDAVWNGQGHVDGYTPSASGVRQIHVRAQKTDDGVEVAAFVVADARMLAHFILDDCVEGAPMFPGCAQLACNLAAPTLNCQPCEDGFPTCITYSVHATANAEPQISPLSRDAVCNNDACADEPECL